MSRKRPVPSNVNKRANGKWFCSHSSCTTLCSGFSICYAMIVFSISTPYHYFNFAFFFRSCSESNKVISRCKSNPFRFEVKTVTERKLSWDYHIHLDMEFWMNKKCLHFCWQKYLYTLTLAPKIVYALQMQVNFHFDVCSFNIDYFMGLLRLEIVYSDTSEWKDIEKKKTPLCNGRKMDSMGENREELVEYTVSISRSSVFD